MKAKISFCLTVFMFLTGYLALPIYAQQLTADGIKAELVLDFKTKKIQGMEIVEKLKPGDLFQVRVKNINQNLYKISVNRKDSIISQSEFKADLFTNFNFVALAKLAGSLSPVGGVLSIIPDPDSYKKLLALGTVQNEGELNQLYGIPDKKDRPSPGADVNINTEIIAAVMNKTQNAYQLLYSNLLELKKALRQFEKNFSISVRKFSLVTENHELQEIFNPPISFSTILAEYDALNDSLLSFGKKNTNIYINYSTAIMDYLALINENGRSDLKNAHSRIVKYHEEQTKVIAGLENKMNSISYNSILKNWIIGTNNRASEFVSFPLQYSDQLNKLEIEILPRNGENRLQVYNTTFVFPFKEKKDFWGVSSGFYVSGLTDEGFSTQASVVETDTVFNIIREDPGEIEFGVSAMIRYGRQFKGTEYFGWQLGFGPALSLTNKIKPRLQIGGGLYTGKKQKVLFDAGLIIGSVDRLSKVYSTEDSYSERPTDVMVSKTTTGLYFSISYLFGL